MCHVSKRWLVFIFSLFFEQPLARTQLARLPPKALLEFSLFVNSRHAVSLSLWSMLL